VEQKEFSSQIRRQAFLQQLPLLTRTKINLKMSSKMKMTLEKTKGKTRLAQKATTMLLSTLVQESGYLFEKSP
jgi:outer membrane biogenesis lipoprotein LolB